MAILYFYIENEQKMNVLVKKHKNEDESDLTFRWAKYAQALAMQLNFNDVSNRNIHIDQGASILFLSKKIVDNNEINYSGQDISHIEGYYDDYDYEYDDDFEEFFNGYDDENDVSFQEIRPYFEPVDTGELINALNDDAYIAITLDIKESIKYIGGLTTPSCRSAWDIYSALKEKSKQLADNT